MSKYQVFYVIILYLDFCDICNGLRIILSCDSGKNILSKSGACHHDMSIAIITDDLMDSVVDMIMNSCALLKSIWIMLLMFKSWVIENKDLVDFICWERLLNLFYNAGTLTTSDKDINLRVILEEDS